MWHGQAEQDRWVIDLHGDGPGVFVDVGAYDGLSTSNTLCLEVDYGWTGVCIEPDPAAFDRLQQNRNCTTVHSAVSEAAGLVTVQPTGQVCPAATLSTILDDTLQDETIDYLSIDVEGYEVEVLRGMDFRRWHVRLITIEHNAYRDGTDLQERIYHHLTHRGFRRDRKDVGCIDPCPSPAYVGCSFEDWYVHTSEPHR